MSEAEVPDPDSTHLAVIGMAGRFPGARDLAGFWENLLKGVDSITRLPADAAGFVPALGLLDGADEFDAGFFGYPPSEALILDPQHRLFLECAWHALEDAGHCPQSYPGTTGIYAGSSQTAYLDVLYANRDRLGPVGDWQLRLATSVDLLTTRVAHRFGLTGPAVTVQTACSTSLVAVHLAAQALLAGECDVALAGGVSVNVPPRFPEYTEGGVISPDGYCRAFDARAGGTVGANGVGLVVLKRLSDALLERDHIRAVLRGTAINNDGLDKVGFTAPSVRGQAAVIRSAQLAADVDPTTIGYVEAHGTGTPLGDPIEIAALTEAFRHTTDEVGFCRIGAVKANIGHTDAAAGIAGFTKAVLAVENGTIPPSLHFSAPNPEIPLADSPFVINTELYEWRPTTHPRRAGISSFGIGGTNAHAVVEEPPARPADAGRPAEQLLVLSARTDAELDRMATRLAEHLQRHPQQPLADVAWTLQTGRTAFAHRRFAVAGNHPDATEALAGEAGTAAGTTGRAPGRDRPVAFVFPGQGGQHPGMGRALYADVPVFRDHVDDCSRLLAEHLGRDLRELLYPADEPQTAAAQRALQDMSIAQPAVFVIEYALARMWQDWGVEPSVVAGHSLGSFAAACIAGVLSLPDALWLVAERGKLLGRLPVGAVLAVAAPEQQIGQWLDTDAGVGVAAVNGPTQCVVSGPVAAIGKLHESLAAAGIDARKLHIGAPVHTAMVDPVVPEFAARLAEVEWRPPTIPWLSETTGAWASPTRAPTVDYWVAHLRSTVRFADALGTLLGEPGRVLLEVGPGRTLTSLARRHPGYTGDQLVLPSLPHAADAETALHTALHAAGRLWTAGAELDWARLHDGRSPYRAALPTYPFSSTAYVPSAEKPAPRPPMATTTAPAPAPSPGGLEAELTRIFGLILGLDQVAPDDNFFELGGDSLLAVQLANAVRQACGVPIKARQAFANPTPARLARLVEEVRSTAVAQP